MGASGVQTWSTELDRGRGRRPAPATSLRRPGRTRPIRSPPGGLAMMKVLSTLVLIVAVLIAGVFLFAATRPSAYHVERSATMTAPPSTVFATINDLHQWENWSPWA